MRLTHARRSAAVLVASILAITGVTLSAHAATAPAPLMVGVGRADITPPTGHVFQGWVEASAVGKGVNTRLYARAIVLEQGGKKFALVAEDANGIAGGVLLDAIKMDADLGFTPQNVLDSASHTHAAPSGYSNYDTYNTYFMDTSSVADLTSQNVSGSLDDSLYAFEVRQLALALRRANADLGPGSLGWGSTQLIGLTQNRSLDAHLADYGVKISTYGTGTIAQDPGGYVDTIDPDVQLLRVDKTLGGKDYAVGTWETFADHGTVNKATWDYYNADHHGTADRVVEAAMRSAGVPAGQDVVSAYGNGDEGDQTAGIAHSGPADAEYVGNVEAAAFMTAFNQAGANLDATPTIDSRWTQVSMVSQATSGGGPTDADAVTGLPLFTGSEEGRGPLYENTGQQFEGDHLPVDNAADPAQGDKIQVRTGAPDSVAATTGMAIQVPTAVPMMLLRIDDRAIASVPGEMTVTMGQRYRAAIEATVSSIGVKHIVIAGLANEYLSYFTTPQEYEEQDYEGGSTLWGEYASYRLLDTQVLLGQAMAAGTAAPAPDTTDLVNGVTAADTAPYPTGATSATAMTQPTTTQRLNQAVYTWQGGAGGYDLPVDTATTPDHAFITIRRLVDGSWVPVTDDTGLQMYWGVDSNGVYTAHWEIPLDATLGSYDMLVTANNYTLTSSPFDVVPSLRLTVVSPSAGTVNVGYPAAVYNSDITYRPALISSGTLNGVAIPAASGSASVVAAGAAEDAFGNCNGTAFGTTGTVTACPAIVIAPAATAAPVATTVASGTTASGVTAAKPTVNKPVVKTTKKSAAKKIVQPQRTLAFTGLPVGLGGFALMLLAVALLLGAVLRRRARA